MKLEKLEVASRERGINLFSVKHRHAHAILLWCSASVGLQCMSSLMSDTGHTGVSASDNNETQVLLITFFNRWI